MAFISDSKIPRNLPIKQYNRIEIIDSLRGLAVLGILLINITRFSLPKDELETIGFLEDRGINFYLWYIFGHGVFEGSFRAIFSMLFGASFLIYTERIEKKSGSIISSSEYFVRRQLWLLFFGLINAFLLLWSGDILYFYAIGGVVLIGFRGASVRNLILASIVTLFFLTIRENKDFFAQKRIIIEGEKVAQIDTSVVKLNWKQLASINEMNAFKHKYSSEEKKTNLVNQINKFRSGYKTIYDYVSDKSVSAQTYGLYYFHFFDVLIFMFLGMAFFKSGIIQGENSTKIYFWITIIGLIFGLFLSWYFLQPIIKYEFNNYEVIKNKTFEFYELQRFIRSVGIFGMIMLLYKTGWLKLFFYLMKPVGRMAFTNYISQSVICALLFYGFGLGLYGKFERYQLFLFSIIICIFQIIWSKLWLKYFYFGPLEWLWRSLTYWEIQPLLKSRLIWNETD